MFYRFILHLPSYFIIYQKTSNDILLSLKQQILNLVSAQNIREESFIKITRSLTAARKKKEWSDILKSLRIASNWKFLL